MPGGEQDTMRAIFHGGPLDGKDDLVVPDDQTQFEFLEYAPERLVLDAPDPTSILEVIRHVYVLRNDVGTAGLFDYKGTR